MSETQAKGEARKYKYLDESLFTFDDIPENAHVYFRGISGWVTKMGDDVAPQVNARHIEISLQESIGGRDTIRLHERLVNKYLHEKRRLWVNLGNHMKYRRNNNVTEE